MSNLLEKANKYLSKPPMDTGRALLQILFVAVVIGATLSVIFLPLMEFERLSGNEREYRVWLVEWVVFDVLLTLGLCRKELRALIRCKPPC